MCVYYVDCNQQNKIKTTLWVEKSWVEKIDAKTHSINFSWAFLSLLKFQFGFGSISIENHSIIETFPHSDWSMQI